MCVLCDYASPRLYRLRSHAVAKHGLAQGSSESDQFLKRCQSLSCRGDRTTTEDKVIGAMGRYAASKSHRQVVAAVLKSHRIDFEADVTGADAYQSQAKTVPAPVSRPFGRAATYRAMKSSGFIVDFDQNLCKTSKFYFRIKSRGSESNQNTVLANAQLIHRYIHWAAAASGRDVQSANELKLLMDSLLAKSFVTSLRTVMQPTSVRNHASAVLDALELILVTLSTRRKLNSTEKWKLRVAAVTWTKLKRKMDKESRAMQRAKINEGALELAPLSCICAYLGQLNEFGILDNHISALSRGIREGVKHVPIHLAGAWRELTAYLAGILLIQGMRLCVALKLKISEYEDASWRDGLAVVRVRDHKTVKHSGPAAFVLKIHQYSTFEKYLTLRRRISTPRDTMLISTHGGLARDILEPIQGHLRKEGVVCGSELTFNDVRKTLETMTYLVSDESSGNNGSPGIMRYLCHGPSATRSFYRFRTDGVVVNQWRKLEVLIAQILSLDDIRAHPTRYLPATAFGESHLWSFQILSFSLGPKPNFDHPFYCLQETFQKAFDSMTNCQ